MARERLRGIFTPNMVPLDAQGRINEGELRRLVEFLIQRGVHGLYPNGTMGEFVRFSFEEHKEIVRIVADQNRGRVKILAGAAEFSIEKTLAACEYYAQLGCDTVAVVPPWYYRLSQDSIYEHFATLARSSPIDITVYNIPQFTNNEISIDILKRLVELPRIVAIKDSSRDMPRFLNTINEIRPLRPDFSFLIGCEEILVPTLVMGGDGGTIATSGVVPEVLVAMFNCVDRGDIPRAVRMQYSVLRLINAMLFGAGFPEGFRAAMDLRGFHMGQSRQPLAANERCNVEELQVVLHEMLKEFNPDPLVPPPPASPVCATRAAAGLSPDQVRAVVREVVLRLQQEGSR